PKPPADCAVSVEGAAADSPIALSEGGRARVHLVSGADVTALDLDAGAPAGIDGLAVHLDAGGMLTLKPCYGSGGKTIGVPLEVTCGSVHRSETLTTTVRALAWQQLPAWTPHVDGPPSREYGSMWIDPADPDRLLLFGGFLYE